MHEKVFGHAAFRPLNAFLMECGVRGLGANGPVDVESELRQARVLLAKKTAPVVFDVGANIGEFSIAMRKHIPQAVVFAFEPSPKTFQELNMAAKAFDFIALNMGCGGQSGSRILYDRQDSGGGAHATLVENVIETLDKMASRKIPVEIITIDEFVKQRSIACIDLLKIDVEGAELEVLAGARDSIAGGKIAAVQFEFNEMNTISRTFMADFFAILPGYSFFRIGLRSLIPLHRETSAFYNEIFAYQNVLAISNPGQARVEART